MQWRSFRLGESTIWLDRHLVVRGGRSIQLQPKVIEVLRQLIAADGETVSRETIKSHIWGNSESDDLLSNAVWKLRKALGDGDLIETIPRFGYRLTQSPNPVVESKTPPRKRWRVVAAISVALVLVTAAGLIGYWPDQVATPAGPAPFPLLRLTGIESGPSFSADGRTVAFVSALDSYHTDLFVYDRDTGESRQITSDLAWNYHPAFSPDGEQIAVFRYLDGQCWIEIYAVQSSSMSGALDCAGVDGRSLSWTPDGAQLMVAIDGPHGVTPAYLNPATGQHTPDLRFDQQPIHRVAPAMSYDGRNLAVIARGDLGERIEVHGESTITSPSYPHIYALAWSRDNRELFFTSYLSSSRTQLWRWQWQRSQPQKWMLLSGRNTQLVTSSDGLELAYDVTRSMADLWRLRPTSNTMERVAMTAMNESQPAFNWGGNRVAYLADEPEMGSLWVRDLNTGTAQPLAYVDAPVLNMDWIGDSQLIGAIQINDSLDLYLVDLHAETATPYVNSPTDESTPRAASRGDSTFLYYLQGEGAAYRRNLSTGVTQALALEDVRDLRPDPQDRWVYFTRTEHPGLWRQHLESRRFERVAEDLDLGDWGNFDVTSQGYVYLRRAGANAYLVWRDHDHNNQRVVRVRSGFAQGASLSVSGDGTILARVQARYEGDVMAVAISQPR